MKRIGSDQLAVDPFEQAMRDLEKRGETMEPTPEDYALDAMAVANMREIPR